MHGIHSKDIQDAFNELSDIMDEQFGDEICDIVDHLYDTESYIIPETIEAAFCLGQNNPSKKRYTVWWGSCVCWFLGEESDILARLREWKERKQKICPESN